MKISTRRDALFAQLQTVTRAASTRSAVQALSGVHLQARSGAIELRATDMEIGLRVPLDGEVVRDGAVVLPARLLVDVVRALPGEDVTLELRPSEQDVELVAGAATFHIRTLRLEDFPPFPETDADGRVQVPGPAFVETVLKVARSASRDETRPDAPLDGSFEANVPARALQELTRIVQHGSADALSVSVRANQVVFEAAGVVLSSRLIDGQFPNYRQLLPDAYEHELQLSGTEITEVVRRISLLAQKNAPLRLAFSEGELTVSARTPDVGEARETVPVPFQGEPLEIRFNPEFLRDGLEALEGGDVLLKLISPLRPGLIQAADGSGFQYLLEALYFACTGRSCKTANEREVVRFGAGLTRLVLEAADERGAHEITVGFQPGEAKKLRVDGAAVERLTDVAARPLVSVFLPDRLELVLGAPALRRAHLDQVVAALWPGRAGTRRAYAAALGQRNALIANIRAGRAGRGSLPAWDAELARHGIALMADRSEAIERLRPRFAVHAEAV